MGGKADLTPEVGELVCVIRAKDEGGGREEESEEEEDEVKDDDAGVEEGSLSLSTEEVDGEGAAACGVVAGKLLISRRSTGAGLLL